ncbi:unnamed protein product [Diamesa hyperborea]
MSDNKNSDSSDEEIVHSRKSLKSKAVLDSDDENDNEQEKHIENQDETSTDNNMDNSVVTKPILSKYKAIIDSDSSSEDEVEKPEPLSKKKKASSSSEDEVEKPDPVLKKTETSKYKALIDSDSSSEDEVEKSEPSIKKKKSASSSDDSDISGDSGDDDIVIPKDNTEPKTQRKSAAKCVEMSYKKAEELKQTIQSEKQRMDRDAEISVPYHRPKQHTLKEFLARKTAITSSLTLERFKNMTNPMKAIKVSVDDMQLMIQKSKLRQEESEEFFSNCISDEENDDEIDNPKLNDHSSATDIDKIVDPNCEASVLPKEEVALTEEIAPTEEVAQTEVLPTESLMEVDSTEIPATMEPKVALDTISDKSESIESPSESAQASNDLPTSSKDIQTIENALPIAKTLSTSNTNPQSIENVVELMETNVPKQPVEDLLTLLRLKYSTILQQSKEPKSEVPNASTSRNFPSLQGRDNEDMVIDLETGAVKPRKQSGGAILRDYLIKLKNAPPAADPETQRIRMTTYHTLKKTLLEKMHKKRNEIIARRKKEAEDAAAALEAEAKEEAEAKKARKVKEGFEDEAECDSEEGADEEEEESDEEVPEKVYKTVDVNRFLITDCGDGDPNDESLFEPDSDNDEKSSSSSSEEETEKDDDKNQRKSRILKAFVDSDDETSKSSPSNFSEPSYSEELPSELKSLCDPTVSQNQDEDLLEICSGQFAATQATNALFTQRDNLPPSTQDDNELMLLCSGQFETQANEVKDQPTMSQNEVSSPIKKRRQILSSSEDEDESTEEVVKQKKKKKMVKKRSLGHGVRYVESDEDEDNVETKEITNENSNPSSELSEDEVEAPKDEEEIFIDYDSEENEVEVKLNKQQRRKAANDYLENEAEMSGSEWGSADEDEKEMDNLMVEMGDEEQFDQDELREEVGRIHMRKMLDDDLKNVKKITNLLFDDEENDGAERDRKFRWKNNTEGFNIEDENARDADEALKDGEELDEDSETLWRKIRHERETILAEQSQKAAENNENINDDVLLLDQSSQTVSNAVNTSLTKRKFQIIKMNNNVEKESKKESPFLISKSRASSASFLARDLTTLNKLANFTKNATDEVSNVGSVSGRGNQFVFTTLSPSVVESKKRGLEENENPLNSSNKKPKLIEKSSRKKLMMLDQLN